MSGVLAAAAVPFGGIVDGRALFDTVLASLVAGIGVTLIASLAIYGFARFGEMRREDRGVASVAAGGLALLASLAFAAVIAVGLVVMING